VTVKSRKRVCDNSIECRGDKKTTTVRYIPNANPVTQGWSVWDSSGVPQNDGEKLVWQVDDDDGSNGESFSKKLTAEEAT
jgi:hypothetical protein